MAFLISSNYFHRQSSRADLKLVYLILSETIFQVTQSCIRSRAIRRHFFYSVYAPTISTPAVVNSILPSNHGFTNSNKSKRQDEVHKVFVKTRFLKRQRDTLLEGGIDSGFRLLHIVHLHASLHIIVSKNRLFGCRAWEGENFLGSHWETVNGVRTETHGRCRHLRTSDRSRNNHVFVRIGSAFLFDCVPNTNLAFFLSLEFILTTGNSIKTLPLGSDCTSNSSTSPRSFTCSFKNVETLFTEEQVVSCKRFLRRTFVHGL
mmetsp:Transcript_10394/g.14674  ORF Transcript_10394/g.14674 Transcript_10394/m.14674 type:complete len:261 (+) Transcript_10394:136-918(+)